ncbi:hypothetical protein [Chelativorans sp. YIM 93263]|uniref:hypothetical protein n=1 Tax=Chelativorans sp. YIM 93263 TaxID=2906648 RepID=UPI002378BF49|nr:hypothetical protein [Chelativorans sp. YIM 93263]
MARTELTKSALASFFLLFGVFMSYAQEVETSADVYRLPCTGPDMQKERARKRLIDPSHPVARHLGPLKFRIPWAYIHPRPFSTHLNCDPDRSSVGIQYWIPDLQAPERDLWFRPEFSPAETGRPNPGPDESAIKVTAIKYYGPGYELGESTVDQMIKGSLRLYDDPELREEYGLTLIRGEGALRWFAQSDKEDLFIFCADPLGRICQGELQLKDWKLQAHFIFLRSAVPHHASITEGMRTLLERWKY